MNTAKNLAPSLPCPSSEYPAFRAQRRLDRQRDAGLISEEVYAQHVLVKKLDALRRLELGAEIVSTICAAYGINPSRPYADETNQSRDLHDDMINEVLRLIWQSAASFPRTPELW